MLEFILLAGLFIIFGLAFAYKVRNVDSHALEAAREVRQLTRDLVMCRVVQGSETREISSSCRAEPISEALPHPQKDILE